MRGYDIKEIHSNFIKIELKKLSKTSLVDFSAIAFMLSIVSFLAIFVAIVNLEASTADL